jgi:hypothetical protein
MPGYYMLAANIYHALLQLKCVGNHCIFLCLENLLVFSFALDLVVFVTLVLKKELVES